MAYYLVIMLFVLYGYPVLSADAFVHHIPGIEIGNRHTSRALPPVPVPTRIVPELRETDEAHDIEGTATCMTAVCCLVAKVLGSFVNAHGGLR